MFRYRYDEDFENRQKTSYYGRRFAIEMAEKIALPRCSPHKKVQIMRSGQLAEVSKSLDSIRHPHGASGE